MSDERLIYGYQAARHQFGPGKIHEVEGTPKDQDTVGDYKYEDELERTICGLWLGETPGHLLRHFAASKVTCLGCKKKVRINLERAAQEAEWKAKQAAAQAEREQQDAEWWEWYQEYLESPEWHELRKRVMERDKNLCQGCLRQPAVEVHHLTYERVGAEMLFDLVAICRDCHNRIPSRRLKWGVERR